MSRALTARSLLEDARYRVRAMAVEAYVTRLAYGQFAAVRVTDGCVEEIAVCSTWQAAHALSKQVGGDVVHRPQVFVPVRFPGE